MPPIVFGSLAVLSGLELGSSIPIPWAAIAMASLVLAACGITLSKRPRLSAFTLLASCLLFGLARAQFPDRLPAVDDIAVWNDRGPMVVRGIVEKEPEQRERSQRLRVNILEIETVAGVVPASGNALVDLPRDPTYRYGDILRIDAAPVTPPTFATFDYRDYLDRQGIRTLLILPIAERIGANMGSPMLAFLFHLRSRITDGLAVSLPSPAAEIAAGLLVGGRTGVDSALAHDFVRTGTSHLLAVSGFNVSLVGGSIVAILLPFLGRRSGSIAAIAGIAAYAVLTGASASALRAAVMGGVGLLGLLLGRQRASLTFLAFAATVLALAAPSQLHDVGYQLSVTATIGIVLAAGQIIPKASSWGPIARHRFLLAAAGPLIESAAATLFSLPIVLSTFGTVSLVALPANLVAAPFVPPAMIFSLVTALAGAVSPDLGRLSSGPAWLFVSGLAAVVTGFGSLPLASIRVDPLGLQPGPIFYLAGFLSVWLFREQLRSMIANALLAFATRLLPLSAILAALAWSWVLTKPDRVLSVVFFDSGQTALVRTPSGRQILVGGGQDSRRLLQALGRELPFWNRRLDILVVPNWSPDRASALGDLTRRYEVETVIGPAGDRAFIPLTRAGLIAKGLAEITIDSREQIDFGDGVQVVVDAAGPAHDSLIVRLGYGAFSIVWLTSGQPEAQLQVAKASGPVTLVDSGSPLDEVAWQLLRPQATIVRAGHALLGSDRAKKMRQLVPSESTPVRVLVHADRVDFLSGG